MVPVAPEKPHSLGYTTVVARSRESTMIDSLVHVLLIGADADLRERLQEVFAQIQGRKLDLEWADSLPESMSTLTRQEHNIYLVAPTGGRDEALTILQQASTSGWKRLVGE